MSFVRFGCSLVFISFIASVAQGGAITISRETTLEASGVITGDSFDLGDNLDTFGPYDNTLGSSLSPEAGGTTSAQATQQSNVAAGSVTGSMTGTAAAQVAELDAISAVARSVFVLVFDVLDQPETLALDGNVTATLDAISRVAVTDGSGLTEFFERQVLAGEENNLSFDEDVLLQPGRYQLIAEAGISGTPTPNSSSVSVSFNVSTTPGTVIPLPAAIWPGMIALGAAAAAIRRASQPQ